MTEPQKSQLHQNMPNGLLSSHVTGSTGAILSNVPLNGVDSSGSSSKTSSPAHHRMQNIPASQLPPSRMPLAPDSLKQMNRGVSNLSVGGAPTITPYTSPKSFTTSTPLLVKSSPLENDISPLNRISATTNSFVRQPNSNSPTNLFDASNNLNHNESSAAEVPSTENGESFNEVPLTNLGHNNNPLRDGPEQHVQQRVSAFKPPGPFPPMNTQPQVSQQQALLPPVSITSTTRQVSPQHILSGTNQPTNQQPENLKIGPQINQSSLRSQSATNLLNQVSKPPQIKQTQSYFSNSSQVQFPVAPINLQQQPLQQNVLQPSPQRNFVDGATVPVSTNEYSQNRPQPNNYSKPFPYTSYQHPGVPQLSQNSYVGGGSNVPPLVPPQQFSNVPLTQQYRQVQPLQPQQQLPPKLSPQTPWNQQPAPEKIQPPPPQTAQSFKTNLHTHRYPTVAQNAPVLPPTAMTTSIPNQQPVPQNNLYQFNANQANVVQTGYSRLWGQETIDLLQVPNIIPPHAVEPPRIVLGQEHLEAANCSPNIMRCTVTKVPSTNTLLQKSRLPLGLLIHPFRDLDHLAVVQCNQIVRCKLCRTYINPFVFFVDMKRWKCNLCYRVNELPDEFQFDPVSKSYGDPSRRPEIRSSTIEFIAPSEYMLRPPQPAVYLFLLDVSRTAVESGYLEVFCRSLADNLQDLPGDARTQIGFIAYNSAIHFYSFGEGMNRPHEMTVLDVDDVFLPCPDNLLVNLHERKDLILELLEQIPERFGENYDAGSALGAALQIGNKLIASTGGRITVFQTCLPNCGPGKLVVREDPNKRSGNDVPHLNPATDFYKKLSLDCSGLQIAVDLFVLNSQYVDLATISCVSRFSGGCIYQYPLFKASNVLQAESLERCLKRYLTRKIGFEAVLRVRCTRGLEIHAFHGNGFIRSMDLLSLPNINPDDGYGLQLSYTESLADLHTVCFQAAVLYTSSKGERRIRVHTMCIPVTATLPEVLASADQQAVVAFLAKMGVDRSMQSSLPDARDAFINAAVDILTTYKMTLNASSGQSGVLLPQSLKFIPLYISALLKHDSFRTGVSTRLDDRVKAMLDLKSLPLVYLIRYIYPDLYPVHNLEDQNTALSVDGESIPQPPRLQLSARSLDSRGAFLMDAGQLMIVLVGPAVSQTFLNEALGVSDYASIPDDMYDLPILNNHHNARFNAFINYLNDDRPYPASLHIIRENSQCRGAFLQRLIEDRFESSLSYHEFLQHLKTQVK